MDITRRVGTNVEEFTEGKAGFYAPMNSFCHVRKFPPAEFKDIVRPNFDTLYSTAWMDLTNEPMILTAPDTKGRYYMLPLLDMWSDVFANSGSRTTGTKEGHFAIVPPNYSKFIHPI